LDTKITFDYLVIAIGMRPSYLGHDEFGKHAPGLKTLWDAEAIRAKILSAYEAAEQTDDPDERARQMTFVLVGAGPTGVELAGSIAEMGAITLRSNFRRIDPAKISILLIEGGKRILPSYAESLSKKAARRIEKLGLTLMTGASRTGRRAGRDCRRQPDRKCDSAVDGGGRTLADIEHARRQKQTMPAGSVLARSWTYRISREYSSSAMRPP
jgi:NADPH-dependent 2,4-dienoyl-CoA reductase/sulfur reductase-like enzyme